MSFTNPTRASWQPGHVPQLKFRNPFPPEDEEKENAPVRETIHANDNPLPKSEDARRPSGPTIRQIRQSMLQVPAPNPPPAPPLPPPPKKKSLFGSLFTVKEPTQMALNQVTAQMIAQHGSTSATRVPNVRMERMPDYVPKVNSKWDGIPDQAKKKEKDRQRALKRQTLGPGQHNRSQSTDSQQRRGRARMTYTSSSNGSRPKSINSNKSNTRNPNPHRFYAVSCNSSGDLAAQQREQDLESNDNSAPRPKPTLSPSSRPPSRTSPPDVAIISPSSLPTKPSPPKESCAGTSPNPTPSSIVDRPLAQAVNSYSSAQSSSAEAIPEHTASPIATPRESSPITPLAPNTHEVSLHDVPLPNGLKIENIPTSRPPPSRDLLAPPPRPIKAKRPTAFLAGEAQELQLPDDDETPNSDLPLRGWSSARPRLPGQSNTHRSIDRVIPDMEKRPDSSRARLGLRASMLVRTDAAPWEANDDPSTPPLSPMSASTRTSPGPLTPRTFLSKSLVGSLRSTRS